MSSGIFADGIPSGANASFFAGLPASTDAVKGNFSFEIEIDADLDWINCSARAKSAGTGQTVANTTWVTVSSDLNTSTTDQKFNLSWASSSLFKMEDGNDYKLIAICWNISQDYVNTTLDNLILDNTVPQEPYSVSPSDDATDTDGTVTFTGTTPGNDTTYCSMQLGKKGYAMSHSINSDICSLEIKNIPEGIYKWYMIASDGSNVSTYTERTLTIDIPTSAKKGAAVLQMEGVKVEGPHAFSITTTGERLNDLLESYWYFIIIVIIAAVIYYRRRKKY